MDTEEKKEAQELEEVPMTNTDIEKYLPNVKIYTDKDLLKYTRIEDLFDNSKYADAVVLLFLDSPTSGHWCALSKIDKTIEFFDSYGGSPKTVFGYAPIQIKNQMGITSDRLSQLMDNYEHDCVYNTIKYQKMKTGVSTCGRFVVCRILALWKYGCNLNSFHDLMQKAKKYYDAKNYDEVVSFIIGS